MLAFAQAVVVATTMMVNPQQDVQRVDFMPELLEKHGLYGCTQPTFSTHWNCKGKRGANGVAALPKNQQPVAEDYDDEPATANHTRSGPFRSHRGHGEDRSYNNTYGYDHQGHNHYRPPHHGGDSSPHREGR